LSSLVPYEPGKPVEEVQHELGLERVVKLASNEGPYGPFPAALDAMAGTAAELNRYPDGGAYRLRVALAERCGVAYEELAIGAGADGVIDCLSQAVLDPSDEIVCGWPSFPSYVIDAVKLGAVPVKVTLTNDRYDVPALVDAVTERTKLVYVCTPNNPTGTMTTRAELDDYFERVPEHVLTVVDQAYFEYIDDPDYPDAIAEYFRADRRVLVIRTFSKIYGLAGLRVGYAVGPADVVTAIGKVRRAFDLNTQAEQAAPATLDAADERELRRSANRESSEELERIPRRHGFERVGPAIGNFVYTETGEDGQVLFEALLREGVIVRPLAGFGAPEAIRVTVGTLEELAFFDKALGRVRASTATR